MKHNTSGLWKSGTRGGVLVALLTLLVIATASPEERIDTAQLAEQFSVDQFGNMIWVERTAPFKSDLAAGDQALTEQLFEQLTRAAWFAQRSFPDVDNKRVFILIPVESDGFKSGVASYVPQESLDAGFARGEDGVWSTNLGAFLANSIVSPCMREDLADLRSRRDGLQRMMEDQRAQLDEVEDDDGTTAATVAAATAISLQLVAMDIADSVEQLQPPAYRIVEEMAGTRIQRGEYWPRELERFFDLHVTGDVVWVDFGTDREVSAGVAYYAVAPAVAFAHMRLGEDLNGKTVVALMQNHIQNVEADSYIASLPWEAIARSLTRSGSTWNVDFTPLQMRGRIAGATDAEIASFREVRDSMTDLETIPADFDERTNKAVRGRTRGVWVTAASAGGNFLFPARELVMAELTVLPAYAGFAVSGGYRTVPYVINAGDDYRTGGGTLQTAAQDISLDSEEVVIRASFCFGTDFVRVDLLQLVLPIRLGVTSSVQDIDVEDALDHRVRYRSGFSIAQGISGRIGPLYLGFTLDWGRWIWSEAPLQVNLYTGLSLKAGFGYRMRLLK